MFKRMINFFEFNSENIFILIGSFNDYCNLVDGFINKILGLFYNI